MFVDALQVSKIAGVGQLVEVNDEQRFILDLLQNEIRSDKPRSARDHNPVWH
jgi:hypothetical protein